MVESPLLRCNCNTDVPYWYTPRVLRLSHRRGFIERGIYYRLRWYFRMCPTWSNWDLLCQFLGCWLLFMPWWVQPVVIVTLHERWLLMMGSLPHNVPFAGSGSTRHPKMIFHSFLVMSCCCLYFKSGWMSPTQVVCMLGFVVSDSCNGKIHHRRQLESLGNFLYLGG